MAALKIAEKTLTVHLAWWEKLGARRSHLTIPRRAIRGIEVVPDPLSAASGLRTSATRIPGVFVAGTLGSGRDDTIFVVCRSNEPGLVIELDSISIERIIVSTPEAERYAEELASAV